MAPVLEENKNLQESVDDLQEHHHREDVEAKVLALEAEHQRMGEENQTLAEQLSYSADQQEGMIFNLVLLMFSVVRRLAMTCSARNGARPFLGGHRASNSGERGSR